MFRVVYDILLRGTPEELACLTKLGELLSAGGTCVGTHASFLCSYRGCVIKVVPQLIKPHYPAHELTQAGAAKLIIESPDGGSLVAAALDAYRALKECGLALRLTPE